MRLLMLSFSIRLGAEARPLALMLISSPLAIVTICDCDVLLSKTVTVPSRAITRRSSAALSGISR